MTIKQSFKFLDAFCLSLKHKVVFLIRKSYQIARAVVIFNPIEMVNNPSFRQRLAVGLFPDKDMLTNIAIPIGSWVVRSMNKDISRTSYSPTFPVMMLLFSPNQMLHFTISPPSFGLATRAPFGEPSANGLATVKTKLRLNSPLSFMGTIWTTNGTPMNQLAAIRAGMLILFLILYLGFIHIIIIPYSHQYINLNQCRLRQELPTNKGEER